MRFLCLHGAGTSAAIFRNQTASFRSKLTIKPEPIFDFIDGPYPSDSAAGISLFYPPPYFSFYPSTSGTDIAAAHTWLLDFLARNGPYDGVMTFSQGGALASTLMLYHATHSLPAPFKVAIFICSGMPLVALDALNIPVSQTARDWDESSKKALFAQADESAILANGRERWLGVTVEGKGKAAMRDEIKENDVFGLNFERIGRDKRIKVPTVHIYGGRDPRFPASLQLAYFCEDRKEFDHGGGHEIPRRRDVSDKIAGLVEWTVQMAGQEESWEEMYCAEGGFLPLEKAVAINGLG